MSNMTQTTKTAPTHDGPCRVDLDLGIGSCRMEDGSRLTTRVLAERALLWADGLDEFADLLPAARRVLCGQGEHSVERCDFDALAETMREFAEYALACGYDTDGSDPDDMLIGQALISGDRISTWLYCDVPCEWTETFTVVRWGEDRAETRVRQAAAHV